MGELTEGGRKGTGVDMRPARTRAAVRVGWRWPGGRWPATPCYSLSLQARGGEAGPPHPRNAGPPAPPAGSRGPGGKLVSGGRLGDSQRALK